MVLVQTSINSHPMYGRISLYLSYTNQSKWWLIFQYTILIWILQVKLGETQRKTHAPFSPPQLWHITAVEPSMMVRTKTRAVRPWHPFFLWEKWTSPWVLGLSPLPVTVEMRVFRDRPTNDKLVWLVVSTHLKNISQNGNLPQIRVKIKNVWNHHLVVLVVTVIEQGDDPKITF